LNRFDPGGLARRHQGFIYPTFETTETTTGQPASHVARDGSSASRPPGDEVQMRRKLMEFHYLLVGFESISKVCRKISMKKEKLNFLLP